VPAEALKNIRTQALPGELDKVADQARSLREWFRGFVREHKGHPLTAKSLAELEPLNRLLERDDSFNRIVAAPKGEKAPLSFAESPQMTHARRAPLPNRRGVGAVCLHG